ncbi:MAG: general secretion pathway protein G [Cryomorphaceae bacterium]|jgi:general secretion pathway protein G
MHSSKIIMTKLQRQQGFTLIEIMVVVVIIGLLATFILPSVVGNQDKAFEVKARADVSQIGSHLALYKLDNYSFPSTAQGLQALVTNPGGKGAWRQIRPSVPKDPWKNVYQYQYPGTKNPSSFDLWSFGADGTPGGEGYNADIGN